MMGQIISYEVFRVCACQSETCVPPLGFGFVEGGREVFWSSSARLLKQVLLININMDA